MFSFQQKIKMIKIDDIFPNPYQIRRNFEMKGLLSLSESIKEHGVLSPVLLRPSQNGYEIICGQRRVRAVAIAGMSEIPAIIINVKDSKCAEISMAENIHRKQLSYIEEGEGYFNLMSYHRIRKEALKKGLSVDFSRINEKIRLLRLDEDIRYKIEEKALPESFAKELLKIHDKERQLELIEKADIDNLTYREFCKIAKKEAKKIAEEHKLYEINKKSLDINILSNTIEETIKLLKDNDPSVKCARTENEEYVEYTIKLVKKPVF